MKEHHHSVLDAGKTPVSTVMRLAWPTIIEQIMLTMVNYVDTAMVGSLGAVATAAIGVNSSTIWLFNGVLGAIAIGFSVQVAHCIGAKRTEDARAVVRQALLCNVVMGLLLGVTAILLSLRLPYWLGAEAAVAPQAGVYFRIFGSSFPFLLSANLFSAILRCMGDTRTPMLFNTMMNVINVVLNFFLIFETRTVEFLGLSVTIPGAGLGVAGAAIASAIAAAITGLALIRVVMRRPSPIQISLKDRFRPDKGILRRAVGLGLPSLLERSTISAGQIVMTRLVAGLGTIAVAANHLATTAESITYMPANGFSMAATTLTGQSIGAKRRDDAVRFGRITIILGIAIMTLTGSLLFFIPRQLVGLFTSDPAVIELGAKVLRVVAIAEPFFGAAIVSGGVLRGGGDTRFPFYISLICMWGLRVPTALFMASRWGLVGVWTGMALDLFGRGLLSLLRFRSRKWLKSADQTAEKAEV